MKTHKKSDGFSVVHLALVLVIIGIVGFTGWYVWNVNKDADKGLKTTATDMTGRQASNETNNEDTMPKIPEGYRLYENRDYGFGFAYPTTIGAIEPADKQGNQSLLFYAKTKDTRDTFAPHTQSPLYVRVDKVDGFVASAKKYGPMLEFKNGTWLVSAKNGGDVNNGGLAIGSTYDAKNFKAINGAAVYDFSYQDEGCYRANWVAKADSGFVTITLPAVCADGVDTIAQDRLDAYKAVVKKVQATLAIRQ